MNFVENRSNSNKSFFKYQILVEVAAAFNFAKKRSIYNIPLRFILIHFTIMDLLSPLRKIGNGLVARAQGNESFVEAEASSTIFRITLTHSLKKGEWQYV